MLNPQHAFSNGFRSINAHGKTYYMPDNPYFMDIVLDHSDDSHESHKAFIQEMLEFFPENSFLQVPVTITTSLLPTYNGEAPSSDFDFYLWPDQPKYSSTYAINSVAQEYLDLSLEFVTYKMEDDYSELAEEHLGLSLNVVPWSEIEDQMMEVIGGSSDNLYDPFQPGHRELSTWSPDNGDTYDLPSTGNTWFSRFLSIHSYSVHSNRIVRDPHGVYRGPYCHHVTLRPQPMTTEGFAASIPHFANARVVTGYADTSKLASFMDAGSYIHKVEDESEENLHIFFPSEYPDPSASDEETPHVSDEAISRLANLTEAAMQVGGTPGSA